MSTFYARSIFFVRGLEQARRHYIEQLGFAEDWNSGDGVLQVSLFGVEIILNETSERTHDRAGHGRLFVGLEDDQVAQLREHVAAKGIHTERVEWGRSTLVIKDIDGNELFFWDWPEKQETAAPDRG